MNLPTQNPTLQEDIVLDGLAKRVVADVNHFFSKERLERAAVLDERERLARELHDGLLQSLITEQQRELRAWIESRLHAAPVAMAAASDISAALGKVCRRAEWQWGLRVELTIEPKAAIPRDLGDAVYRIVQEGLTNVGRHARAGCASVRIVTSTDHACLTLSDDGGGFPFRGRYDLATLNDRNLGPRSIRQRVIALQGEFVLTSALSGSRLEIRLPFARQSRPVRTDPATAA
jgi:signal transduction histidine kinase